MQNEDKTLTEFVPYGAKDAIRLSIGIVQNLIAVKTRTGKTCSENEAVKFIAMCNAKRINPFEGDCFLIGYDGHNGATFSLVTAHQTYLKRAELHQEFDGMESGVVVRGENGGLTEIPGDFVDEGQTLVGGWARVHFKNRQFPMYKRLKLSRFKKNYGIWLEDDAGMIVKCAEADALRSSFPTMLGGLYMREELDINPNAIPIATPKFEVAAPVIKEGSVIKGSVTDTVIERPKTEAPAPVKKPVKKRTPTLSVASDSPSSPQSNYTRLLEWLYGANYTGNDFMAVAHKNKWVPQTIAKLSEVKDEHLAEFLKEDNLPLIAEQLDALDTLEI